MDLQNMQNQSMHFVLSTDAKPRLKWTPELHQRFIEATNQLGGADSEYNTNFINLSISITIIVIIRFYSTSYLILFFTLWHRVAEATPKSLMRVMGIPGLTLYHLKSHLQAFSFPFCNDIIFLCFSFTEYGNQKL